MSSANRPNSVITAHLTRRLSGQNACSARCAGSCWYYLRFADPNNRQVPIDPEKEKCALYTMHITRTP
jgi:hypothetical protein